MFIAEKQIEIPVVEVDLAGREQHGEAFQEINPYRTVPVLALDNGQVLTSSFAIIHYLENLYPEPSLTGGSAEEKAIIMDLDQRMESEGFMAVGEAFRNRARSFASHALTGRHEYPQIPALVERGALRTTRFFEWLDELLTSRPFVAGHQFTIADITAFVTVEFAQWIKQHPAPELVNLQKWYEDVGKRDSAKV